MPRLTRILAIAFFLALPAMVAHAQGWRARRDAVKSRRVGAAAADLRSRRHQDILLTRLFTVALFFATAPGTPNCQNKR